MNKSIDILIIIEQINEKIIDILNKLVIEQLNTNLLEIKINFLFLSDLPINIPISIISRIVDKTLYNNFDDILLNSKKIVILHEQENEILKKINLTNYLTVSYNDNLLEVIINNKTFKKFNFLQIINFYPQYYIYFYKKHPNALKLSYKELYNLHIKEAFGGSHYFGIEMNKLGYDSKMYICNDPILLEKFTYEFDAPKFNNIQEFAAYVINNEKPDILFSSDTIEFDYKLTKLLNHKPRLIIGWRAQVIPNDINWNDYDIILSNALFLKDIALTHGAKHFEELHPGYPTFILDSLNHYNYDYDISFAGQITLEHTKRIKYLEILANLYENSNVNYIIATPNHINIFNNFKIKNYISEELFGLDYYNFFRKSKINLNIHIDMMKLAGNMRLFEITGSGGFLLTDYHDNLNNLFEIGKEVDCFESPQELVEKINYYLKHDDIRSEIANRGQQKCLNHYNLLNSCKRLDKIIKKYINSNVRKDNLTVNTASNEILSPLTKSKNIQLLLKIPSQILVNGYKGYNTNIEYLLKNNKEIYLYQCLDTGYKFFYPFDIDGDDIFYQSLEKFPWYYMQDKWEFDNALSFIRSNDYVLEIGGGRGFFIERLQQKNIKYLGIELNSNAVAHAKNKGLNVEFINLTELAKTHSNTFDFVCAFQVLEHIADVYNFIDAAVKVLKPGGFLYFSVPNDDAFIGIDSNNWLNYPPHHMGRWGKNAFLSLTKIFPIAFYRFEYEPLANYHFDYYKNVANSVIGHDISRIISNYISKVKLKGFTISAIFIKK